MTRGRTILVSVLAAVCSVAMTPQVARGQTAHRASEDDAGHASTTDGTAAPPRIVATRPLSELLGRRRDATVTHTSPQPASAWPEPPEGFGAVSPSPSTALADEPAGSTPPRRNLLRRRPSFGREPVPAAVLNEWNVGLAPWDEVTQNQLVAQLPFGQILRDHAGSAEVPIPALLADRMAELMRLFEQEPDVALNLAASVYTQWPSPEQSEFILERVVQMGERLAEGRGLETALAVIRRFVQQVNDAPLRHRAQLRIGRLYYERGYYAKAVAELSIDHHASDPDRYQTLAGLVRAISLVRLRQAREALALLEWVATRSVDAEQRARAALLLGRLLVLYQQSDQAVLWLRQAAQTTQFPEQAQEAKQLLAQIQAKAQSTKGQP